ncbi:MAG: hypothetical protein WBS15_02725 [Mycobacterium sp.]|uniref:hypothetical protein n=1 Tax=Mycobacterium sp. TaxID=1785 RepID=UPI003BB5E21F
MVSLLMQPSRHAPQRFPLPYRVIRRGHRVIARVVEDAAGAVPTSAVIATRIGEYGVQFALGVSRAAQFSNGLQVARRGADPGEPIGALPKGLRRPVKPSVAIE